MAVEESGPIPAPLKSDTPEKINTKIKEIEDTRKDDLHEN